MALPPEIIEEILNYCDGKTLLNAKKVCKQWEELVEYLSQKTMIWYWCCQEELPKKELIQYLNNYNRNNPNIWYFIYKNWITWQDIPNISFDIVLSPAEIPRITCIDVFENYIAVGSEDGRVRIFNENWKPLSITRHISEKVTKVKFFFTSNLDPSKSILKIVIAYPKVLIIDDLFSDNNHINIEIGYRHSIYNDCICYQKPSGVMMIERLVLPNGDGKFLRELWFARVYNPNNISAIKMWNGICTILIKNDVRKLNYGTRGTSPERANAFSDTPELCVEGFSSSPNSITSQKIHYVLRDDIIIVLHMAENAGDKEFMEVIMLQGGPNFVTKLFTTSEIFEGSSITCICLHGNTLVLGVDSGIVYFYHVPSWKHFSIKDYDKKIIIGKHPITNIVVQETKDKRKFYITSSFNIHEVIGFCSAL